MKKLIHKINDIHDFTYMLFTISVETAILVITLAIFYISNSDSFTSSVYYSSVASDLLISVRDMLIGATVFSVISECVLRGYEK